MKQAVAGDIRLISGMLYIKELMPEQKASKQNSWDKLYIPSFILHMLHMLDFLSSRHVDTMRESLEDLMVLVHHDRRGL